MTDIDTKRAKVFRDARTKKKLTQLELAKLMDVAPATISSYELGTRVPRWSVLARYCKVLGIDIKKLPA